MTSKMNLDNLHKDSLKKLEELEQETGVSKEVLVQTAIDILKTHHLSKINEEIKNLLFFIKGNFIYIEEINKPSFKKDLENLINKYDLDVN